MTLIVGLSSLPFASMSSDRLITLSSRGAFAGEHDPISNKLIVLAAKDAYVCIGYCGSAYLQGLPTDNWIVNTICPEQPLSNAQGAIAFMGFKLPSNLRLHQICNRLRLGLANCAGGRGVTIMIVGWRHRGRFLTPIHLIFGADSPLRTRPDLRMHPDFPLETKLRFIGASVSSFELQNALYKSYIRGGAIDVDGATRIGRNLIVDKSVRDATVGPNVMSVTLINPQIRRFGYSLFIPQAAHRSTATVEGITENLHVAYTPWFLTSNQFHAPIEQTGEVNSTASWQPGDWTFEMREESTASNTPSMVHWTRPHRRNPPPR